MCKFLEAQISFAKPPEEQQSDHMEVEPSNGVLWMVDCICQHREQALREADQLRDVYTAGCLKWIGASPLSFLDLS